MEETNIFEQGSPIKTYLTLAMPVVLSSVISIVYNIADTYFIALTHNTSLIAGVSLCAPVFTILMAFGNVFGQGGSSLMSRLYGQGDVDGTKRVSSFCFYISIIFGLVLGVLMLICQVSFLKVLGSSVETYSYAREYYLVLAIGSPFIALSFIPMNLLRCEGLSVQSMVGSVAGLALNVILDPIMIFNMNMGAAGAALASVLGYVLSDIIYLFVIFKQSKIMSINPKLIKISNNYISQIFGVGVSAAVTNWMSSICLIITNQYLLPYGDDQIAAMGIVQKVAMIIFMILVGLCFGSAPIVGYFYGGKRYDTLKKLLRMIISITTVVAIVMTIILFVAAPLAIRIFLTDDKLINTAVLMLRLQIITMFCGSFIMMTTVCFQASGKGKEALIVSILRQGVVFIFVIFIANLILGYKGILASQMISDVISALIVLWLFVNRFYKTLN